MTTCFCSLITPTNSIPIVSYEIAPVDEVAKQPDYRDGVLAVFEGGEDSDSNLKTSARLRQYIVETLHGTIYKTYDEFVYGYAVKWEKDNVIYLYGAMAQLNKINEMIIDDIPWLNHQVERLFVDAAETPLTFLVESDVII